MPLIMTPAYFVPPFVSFTDFTEQQKIQAGVPSATAVFGRANSMSNDGNTVVVAADLESIDGANAGAAYIFTRAGGVWSEQQKIQSSDIEAGDQYGSSVAISGDGNTVIVGAQSEDEGGTGGSGSQVGAAYIFVKSGGSPGVWTQQQKIQASDRDDGDIFGAAVSISDDGNTVIVGAPQEDPDGIFAGGSAYIFTRAGGVWSEQDKITSVDRETDDGFGGRVAMSGDGNTVIAGVSQEDTGGISAGSAYIFIRVAGSPGTWAEQQKIQAGDLEAGDAFGASVSISTNGDNVIIGATGEDEPTAGGAAYIFTRTGVVWAEQQKIESSDIQLNDNFGSAVSMSGDGDMVIVGVANEDTGGSAAGSTYIFTRVGTLWTEQQKIQASDVAAGDRFGKWVSMSNDGNTLFVGADGEDTGAATAGAAYVFTN